MQACCKYHPTSSAIWFCQSCDTYFCASCVPHDPNNYLPKCTLCRRSLTSVSVAEQIPPFWTRLSSLLVMPFGKATLLLLVLFALLLASLPGGTLGKILLVLVMFPIVEFLFDCMEKIASGDSLDVQVKKYFRIESKSVFLKFLIVYAFFTIGISKLFVVSSGAAWLVSVFFILGVPASLIILMMEKSMFAMLNPQKIIYIIKLFGKAYFVLYVAMFLLLAVCYQLSGLAGGIELAWLAKVVMYSGALYLSFVVCLMAGYLVYQYHHELNFTINRQSLYQLNVSRTKNDLVEVEILIQENRFEDAQRILLNKVKQDKVDYLAYEKLILLYAVQENTRLFNHYCDEYFHRTLELGKSGLIADFYLKLNERELNYQINDAALALAIASELTNKIHFKLALNIIEHVLQQSSLPTNWELLYLLKAKLLHEFANRSGDAKDCLAFISKRSVDQAMLDEADSYNIS